MQSEAELREAVREILPRLYSAFGRNIPVGRGDRKVVTETYMVPLRGMVPVPRPVEIRGAADDIVANGRRWRSVVRRNGVGRNSFPRPYELAEVVAAARRDKAESGRGGDGRAEWVIEKDRAFERRARERFGHMKPGEIREYLRKKYSVA